jgi:hypothetical protein
VRSAELMVPVLTTKKRKIIAHDLGLPKSSLIQSKLPLWTFFWGLLLYFWICTVILGSCIYVVQKKRSMVSIATSFPSGGRISWQTIVSFQRCIEFAVFPSVLPKLWNPCVSAAPFLDLYPLGPQSILGTPCLEPCCLLSTPSPSNAHQCSHSYVYFWDLLSLAELLVLSLYPVPGGPLLNSLPLHLNSK